MKTPVLLKNPPAARKLSRKRRALQPELVPADQTLDRAALHQNALPFLVATLQRWQAEGRIMLVNGILTVNAKYPDSSAPK